MFFANILLKPAGGVEFNINKDILFLANKWHKCKEFSASNKLPAE